jgi:2-haloacid dehalogenase
MMALVCNTVNAMSSRSNAPVKRPSLTAPQAVLFDAYGTLFDVYSVALAAEQLFPGQGQALSLLWRDKQIEYTRLVTTSNHGAHYQPFWALTRAALVFAIKKIAISPANTGATADFDQFFGQAVERLMNQYRSLSAFPENREVLSELQRRGIPTGILSNGDPAMLQLAVKSAGLDGLLTHVISVDPIRKYKTHPEAYALGEQATGLPAGRIAFVSCNAWDALAATWYGYQTLWVNRYQQPFEELGTQPTRTGNSLRAVLDFFPSPPLNEV